MIKKIRVWKVTLLSIVTLSVYSYIWFAFRSNEIIKTTKLKIPNWRWLILPIVISLAAFTSVAFLAPTTGSPLEGLFVIYLIFSVVLAIIAASINIWWVWQFGKAAEKITEGHVTVSWILGYWLILGPAAPIMLQYYFNRAPKNLKLSTTGKNTYMPSQKFVGVSTALIVISVLLYVLSYLPAFGV